MLAVISQNLILAIIMAMLLIANIILMPAEATGLSLTEKIHSIFTLKIIIVDLRM